MNRTLATACAVIGALGITVLTVNACGIDVAATDPTTTEETVVIEPAGSDYQPGGLIEPASLAAALETPCEQEDSVNCYWRADLRGNGQGTSFVNVEGHVYPLTTVLADR